MSARYQTRNVTSVHDSLVQQERIAADDLPSDSEEDNEESQTDSESEEDIEDEPFEASTETEVREGSESEDGNTAGPSTNKRKRPISRASSMSSRASSRRGRRQSIYLGKDGHRWYTTARERPAHNQRNVRPFLPGPIGEAKSVRSPLDAWSLLFSDALLEKVVYHTNEEIKRYRDTTESETVSQATYADVDLCELKAFIGVLYLSGLQKTAKSTSLEDMWSHDFGSVLYRCTMSRKRFTFLLRMLCFDDKTTRSTRRETDKFAPIREIWEDFISKCTSFYCPATYCTVDEQLISFRGRCPFKVYNGAKPDKYGIKIVMLNDSRTFYMYTAEPYVGKVQKENIETVPSYYIRKLTEPLHGTSRNITCDNWFSSTEIFDRMLSRHSITMVGTLRKNKRQIPQHFKAADPVHSSRFLFDETKTLVKYTPKKNKFVLLLSSLHWQAEVDQQTQKPSIISFYNDTKGGTDCFDQMCHEYTTARKTLRWPMRFWYGMLDQGGINALILHNFNIENPNLVRREFLKQLVRSLIEPHLRVRLCIVNAAVVQFVTSIE
ncbi:piggyBac transposable element-derived protein 4-like [Temnothorax nylanderi]|uniref:piggyBac transposable element-derived protein 4-like n=1 Tax=Temnothorax nylanderi TaxID=102681 RepID=UPI003A884B39